MSTRIIPIGLSLLLAAALAACGSDGPAGPGTQAFTATNVAVSNSVDPAGRCAPDQTLNIEGAGSSSLGAITIRQSHCFNQQGANPLAFYNGQFTNTFADGGSFSGTYAGTSSPTANPALFGISGEWQITGGTGRYAGATGSGTATGQANVQTGQGSISLEGAITR